MLVLWTSCILLILGTWPGGVTGEKLSVLLPGQNAQFDIDNGNNAIDVRSDSVVDSGLSPPDPDSIGGAPAPIPVFPPAPVEESPRQGGGGSLFANNGNGIQGSLAPLSGLYEVPDAGSAQQTVGSCQAQILTVTSVSQVPTTVVRDRVVATTVTSFQTNFQTSFVTVQGPPVTRTNVRTVTRQVVVPQTQVVTSTRVQQQLVTTTFFQRQTQVVTRPVRQLVTVVSTQERVVSVPVISTVVRQQIVTSRVVIPEFVTVTSTQFAQDPGCASSFTSISSSGGYDYPPGGYDYPQPNGGLLVEGGSLSPLPPVEGPLPLPAGGPEKPLPPIGGPIQPVGGRLPVLNGPIQPVGILVPNNNHLGGYYGGYYGGDASDSSSYYGPNRNRRRGGLFDGVFGK